MLIEAKVDYSKSRNLLLSAIILVVGISGISLKIGQTQLRAWCSPHRRHASQPFLLPSRKVGLDREDSSVYAEEE